MRTEKADKADKAEDKRGRRRGGNRRSIRVRLTTMMILFALLILGCLWAMQIVFLEPYYESAMEKKSDSAMNQISDYYANTEELTMDEFCRKLGTISSQSGVYFYLESLDGSFKISSSDVMTSGRIIAGGAAIVERAREHYILNGFNSGSYITTNGKDNVLLSARKVSSEYRDPVYLYSIAPLAPLGSAVSILSNQLKLVTLAALALAVIIAFVYSRYLSAPIRSITDKAKLLGQGDYDVRFEGGRYMETRELARTLTETAGALKRSEALQKDLLANVSHDLRTPLTMVKSYAELIRDISGDDPERRNEHLGVIIDEADRLSELVGDILLISKLQAGAEEMELKDVDIQKAAESVLATYRVLEENEDFTFETHMIEGTVLVKGDEHKLQQVFSNLISNAVRYSRDEDRFVGVYFTVDDGILTCSVRDHGVGIPEDELDSVWNRYQRASQTNSRLRMGTGLGLSIAREILEVCGARYGVSSEVGKGSNFWFSMPCKIVENPIDNI